MATETIVHSGAEVPCLSVFQLRQDATTKSFIFGILCVVTALWYVVPYMTSPLHRYPGPFLAALSNYWRMYYAAKGSMHLEMKSLHEKYGPIVRTAPNQIDLDCPSLIKICFERQGRFPKTEFYSVSGVKQNGKITYNIFSETSSIIHARMKKPVAKYYSPKSILALESKVDEIINHFTCHLDNRFAGSGSSFGPVFDFGQWLLYLTWDLVGQVTFSRPFGYLDKGFDFDGTLRISRKAVGYLSVVGMQPSLDYFLDKNPFYRIGPPGFNALVNISLEQLGRRIKRTDKHDDGQADFLDHFIEAKASAPDVVDDPKILSYLLINMAAGADTTAITMRSIFYLSLKHPKVWARLEKEVIAATRARGRDAEEAPVSFQTARAVPYLEAVTRESLRLYPGNCFSMERYVPKGGLHLPDGSLVPEGTAVGFNAYVINRNQDIWGPDAECFVPERWIRDKGKESEEQYRERIANMMKYDLSFGGGNRKCIGMHLGLMEVYKIAATLIRRYEFELVTRELVPARISNEEADAQAKAACERPPEPQPPASFAHIKRTTDVLQGRFEDQYTQRIIIDCRFEYEYEGGHIDGAINYYDKELLMGHLFETPMEGKVLLILHCEYSAHRAPMMARFIRSKDRAINAEYYPRLSYPEIYILDGGYNEFFTQHPHRCCPQSYVEMNDKKHVATCEREMGKLQRNRKGLGRAKTFTFGPHESLCQASPTVPGRNSSRDGKSFKPGVGRSFTRRAASY